MNFDGESKTVFFFQFIFFIFFFFFSLFFLLFHLFIYFFLFLSLLFLLGEGGEGSICSKNISILAIKSTFVGWVLTLKMEGHCHQNIISSLDCPKA